MRAAAGVKAARAGRPGPAAGVRFHIVDVFAPERHSGNPLAVVLLERPLSSKDMQAIAAEFGFSETTFVTMPEKSHAARARTFEVRIFTPKRELPFAGHPTLGTAHVLRTQVCTGNPAGITLRMQAGAIPVVFDDGAGLAWMKQGRARVGPARATDLLERALGLMPGDLDPEFAPREVTTGVPFLLVPLTSERALERVRFDARTSRGVFGADPELPLYAFCRVPREEGFGVRARMFAPTLGVAEDPATGSAAGCLAAYALSTGYLPGPEFAALIAQGAEVGRPSEVYIRARKSPGRPPELRVGGAVVEIAEGTLK